MPQHAQPIAPTSYTTFGDLLKYLRQRARLIQREVAIEIGYREVYISRLESNQRAPDPNTLLRALQLTATEDDSKVRADLRHGWPSQH